MVSGAVRRINARKRYAPPSILRLLALILVALGLVFGMWVASGKPQTPFVALFVGNPMAVTVFLSEPNRAVVLLIPADTEIDGTYSVGRYSLESLWKLGRIDKEKRDVLRGSLAEALGIPINRVTYPQGDVLASTVGDNESFTSALAPIDWPKRIIHPWSTASLRDFIWMWWMSHDLDSAGISVIDIEKAGVLSQSELPDHTVVRTIDALALDKVIGNSVEDGVLRREALAVAVYNTTRVGQLGGKIARTLEHMGVHVVSVGNDEPEITRCLVQGSAELLTSKTANFLAQTYNCQKDTGKVSDSSDLQIRLGTDYSETTDGKNKY